MQLLLMAVDELIKPIRPSIFRDLLQFLDPLKWFYIHEVLDLLKRALLREEVSEINIHHKQEVVV